MSNIGIYGEYGDPRKQAREANRRAIMSGDADPHGLSPAQIARMEQRMETFLPKLAGRHGQVHDVLGDILPEGATLSPGAGAGYRDAVRRTANMPAGSFGGGISGGTFETPQRPYQPEFESPDRQQYPVHRILANRYWRLFYKLDHVIGNGIDMYGELPWGNVEFTGDGVDGEIKDVMDYSWDECQMRSILPYATREFFVVGEAAPHLFWDDTKGCWTFCALHNPDQLEVIDAPFIKMDPVVEFIPDQRLQQVLNSNHAMLRQVRESMPQELLVRLMARQNIPLSPVNFTFLPRKLHPYDTRGTSIISRMWRILMYEDAIYNASIATARRHAGPLKVAKLGNPQNGWIPGPEHERKLLELLANAELDVNCFVPETPVVLGDGTECAISDLKPGDIVLDRNGQPSEVAAVKREQTRALVRVHIAGDETVDCTPNHAWPVWGGPRTCSCGCGTLIHAGNFAPHHGTGYRGEYIVPESAPTSLRRTKLRFLPDFDPHQRLEARELRAGDWLKIPRSFKECRPQNVTLKQAWLLGLYAADGNAIDVYKRADGTVRRGFELSLNIAQTDLADRVDSTVGYATERFTGDRNNLQVRARRNESSELANWLSSMCPGGATTKALHVSVLQWPLDLKRAFIEGYTAGDGCVVGNKYIELGSASRQLARQIKLIVAHLGALAAFSTRRQGPRSFGAGNPFYRLHIHGTLAAELGGFEPKRHHRAMSWADDDYVYVRVTKVEHLQCHPREVINIAVCGDHSYMVNGVGTFNSWLVYHYAINFELVGTTERVMSIDKHNEIIERVKLIALGISKAFLHGEVTYASAASGLTVFLQRLKALRQYFEAKWLLPKFFLQMAKINKWVKPTQAELDHRVRIRRSNRELIEDARFVVPRLEWDRTLDPSVDGEMISAMQSLQDLGVQFSKNTLYSLVGRDFEDEAKQRVRDYETEKRIFKDHPELMAPAGGEGMPGGAGGPMLPGMEPGAFGEELAPGDEGAPPEEAPGTTEAADDGGEPTRLGPFEDRDKIGVWTKSDIRDVLNLMEGEEPDDEPWLGAYRDSEVQFAMRSQDPNEIWEALEEYLTGEEFPPRQVRQLDDILKKMNVIQRSASGTRRSDRVREAQLLDMIDGYGGHDLLAGAG